MGEVIYVDFRGDWVCDEVYDPYIVIQDENSGDLYYYFLEDDNVMIISSFLFDETPSFVEFEKKLDALFED